MTAPNTATVRPFRSGSEFAFWVTWNCRECRKWNPDQWRPGDCEIDYALGLAYIGDGFVTPEIAARAGLPVPYPDGEGVCHEIEYREETP